MVQQRRDGEDCDLEVVGDVRVNKRGDGGGVYLMEGTTTSIYGRGLQGSGLLGWLMRGKGQSLR